MKRILAGILGLLLILGSVAWWKTRPPTLEARKQAVEAITTTDLVDQTTYTTAQRLARLALTPEEQVLAQSALRIADHELDLAFSEALIDAEAHPPALNSDAQAIQARIVKSQSSLNADQQQVSDLTAAIAQAKPAQKDELQNQLDVAQSQLELETISAVSAKCWALYELMGILSVQVNEASSLCNPGRSNASILSPE